MFLFLSGVFWRKILVTFHIDTRMVWGCMLETTADSSPYRPWSLARYLHRL